MRHVVLALPILLSACAVETPEMQFRAPIVLKGAHQTSHLQLRTPFAANPFDPSRLSVPYRYRCLDGTVVTARYDGTRYAQLDWDGRRFVAPRLTQERGAQPVTLDPTFGYRRDDVTWHRHGAEALLINGYDTIPCRLTNAAGVLADEPGAAPTSAPTSAAPLGVTPDAYGGGKAGKF